MFTINCFILLSFSSYTFWTRGQTLMSQNPDTAFSSVTQNCLCCMTDVARQVRSKGIGDDGRNEKHCELSDQSLQASFIRFAHTHTFKPSVLVFPFDGQCRHCLVTHVVN